MLSTAIAQAKVNEVTKELSQKLINKEITSKELFEGLEEIEKYKIQQGLIGKW